jgi:regulator of RNase E activity RraA
MPTTTDVAPFPVSLIADGLDACGLHDQVLPSALGRLIRGPKASFAGPARTIAYRRLPEADRFRFAPREVEATSIAALEAELRRGDVVAIGFEDGPPELGIPGGMYALMFSQRGCAGLVTEGYVRDIDEIEAIGFPVVARGSAPANGRGRMKRLGVGPPIRLGGIPVRTGDVLVADSDGVVVVPIEEIEGERLLAWLRDSAGKETDAIAMLRAGSTLSEVFLRFGQL